MEIQDPTIDRTAFCAPGAFVYGDVTIGELAVVMFGVVIRADSLAVSVSIDQ